MDDNVGVRMSVCNPRPGVSPRCAVCGPAQWPPSNPLSVSNKKKYAHRSYPLVAPICLSLLSARLRLQGVALGQRTASGLPARRGSRLPPSRGAWLPALPTRRDARQPDCQAGPAYQAQRAAPMAALCLLAASRCWCLPAASCSCCHRPTTYKRHRAAASSELHTPTSLYSLKQQGDVTMCWKHMLHADVSCVSGVL
jgi:hypothetical protein